MADVHNGGRIVPVMATRQPYSNTPPSSSDEATSEQSSQETPQVLPQDRPQSRSSRTTRAKQTETECLELPCLKKLGLYALPTEGDGTSFLPLAFKTLYTAFSIPMKLDRIESFDCFDRFPQEIASTMPSPINCMETSPTPTKSVSASPITSLPIAITSLVSLPR